MIEAQARHVRQRIVFAVVLCHAVTALPPVFAAPAASAERVTVRRLQTPAGVITGAPSVADIAQLRRVVTTLQDSRDARLKAQGTRLSRWLAIVAAPTPAERHSAIRRLPVTVTESAPADGRAGVVKTFVAGGKPRRQIFVPAAPAADPSEQPIAGGPGGPRADGPAQDVCYYEGQPDTCATQQELEDLAMIVSAAAAEVDVMQAEYDASYAEYQAYCAQNPWECEEWERPAGPSACGASCAGQAVNAVASIATAGATTYLVGEGLITGAIATTGAAVASGVLVGAAVVVAGWTAWEWYKCMRPKIAAEALVGLVLVAEPV